MSPLEAILRLYRVKGIAARDLGLEASQGKALAEKGGNTCAEQVGP